MERNIEVKSPANVQQNGYKMNICFIPGTNHLNNIWVKMISRHSLNEMLSGALWHYIMIVFCDDEGRCLLCLCEAKPVLFDIRYEREWRCCGISDGNTNHGEGQI